MEHEHPNQPAASSAGRYKPAIGRDFELTDVPAIEAKTRNFIARIVVIMTALAVLGAGSYSLVSGNFTAVSEVWAVTGPIVGSIVTYYFGPQRKDTG